MHVSLSCGPRKTTQGEADAAESILISTYFAHHDLESLFPGAAGLEPSKWDLSPLCQMSSCSVAFLLIYMVATTLFVRNSYIVVVPQILICGPARFASLIVQALVSARNLGLILKARVR